MNSHLGNPVLVRAVLICLACDIPASRKVSGFLSHSAFHACSRCLKEFPTSNYFGDKPDYSGFDRSNWTPWTNTSHRFYACKNKECKTGKDKKAIERNHGCQYSVLLELPYYDVVRMCVVDPMHNLLLGTAQHVVSVWKQFDWLDLSEIQLRVDRLWHLVMLAEFPWKFCQVFHSLLLINGAIGPCYILWVPLKEWFLFSTKTAGFCLSRLQNFYVRDLLQSNKLIRQTCC